jgi:hypothetical protein
MCEPGRMMTILKGARMKAQERGMREVLDDAEGLANVLRIMSEGKLDLFVVTGPKSAVPGWPVQWAAARRAAAPDGGQLPGQVNS